jgi:coenzyme F420 hydrogenase subunit beta
MLTYTRDSKIVFNSSRCCQCGVCVSACPYGAIAPHTGRRQYELVIDPGKCTECQLCIRVCPAHALSEARIAEDTLPRALGFHLAAARDMQVRRFASSGGVARVLLCNGIRERELSAVYTLLFTNVTVDGASNLVSVGGEAMGTWVQSPMDGFKIPTSLYRPVLWGAGLREGLPRAGRVLLVGLPCQLRGAKALLESLRLDVEPLYVSLFCRKTKEFGYSRYILQMARCEDTPTYHVLYRGDGWPGRFRVLSAGRTCDVGPFLYHAQCWNVPGCRYCADCIGSGIADLTLGDPWGIISESNEPAGMTLVYVWTRKGRELLDWCQKHLDMRPLTVGQVEHHFDIRATRAKEALVNRRLRSRTLHPPLPFEWRQLKSRIAEHLLTFHPHSRVMKALLRSRTILKDRTI